MENIHVGIILYPVVMENIHVGIILVLSLLVPTKIVICGVYLIIGTRTNKF
jgi:hypothetical protein